MSGRKGEVYLVSDTLEGVAALKPMAAELCAASAKSGLYESFALFSMDSEREVLIVTLSEWSAAQLRRFQGDARRLEKLLDAVFREASSQRVASSVDGEVLH